MAENMPQRPAGFQAPGIPGAGNILDPAVRAELREKVHDAVHPANDQSAETGNKPTEAPASPANPPVFRAGPFPHGDVDLRGLVANVVLRPQRGRTGRRFYFLPVDQPAEQASSPPSPTPPAGPKPG